MAAGTTIGPPCGLGRTGAPIFPGFPLPSGRDCEAYLHTAVPHTPPIMQWYYSKNGTQLGPVEQVDLIAKMVSGEVSPGDLVWREGMVDWLPSGQIGELRAMMPVPSQPAQMGGVPSPYAAPAYSTEVISSYLWQSIVVTVLCCWPCGIPAIVYAAKVEGLKARGDIAGAKAASANAKKWCWISLAGWLVFVALYAIFIASMAFSSTSSHSFPR